MYYSSFVSNTLLAVLGLVGVTRCGVLERGVLRGWHVACGAGGMCCASVSLVQPCLFIGEVEWY